MAILTGPQVAEIRRRFGAGEMKQEARGGQITDHQTSHPVLATARGATEQPLTVQQAARELGISDSSMRRLVRDQPGVFELGKVHKKRFIPRVLLDRIKQEGSRGFVANFQLGYRGVQKTLVRRRQRTTARPKEG